LGGGEPGEPAEEDDTDAVAPGHDRHRDLGGLGTPPTTEPQGCYSTDRGRFGIRVISGHKGVAERKTFVEQHLRVITRRPPRASTTIAQSTVHRGVRK